MMVYPCATCGQDFPGKWNLKSHECVTRTSQAACAVPDQSGIRNDDGNSDDVTESVQVRKKHLKHTKNRKNEEFVRLVSSIANDVQIVNESPGIKEAHSIELDRPITGQNRLKKKKKKTKKSKHKEKDAVDRETFDTPSYSNVTSANQNTAVICRLCNGLEFTDEDEFSQHIKCHYIQKTLFYRCLDCDLCYKTEGDIKTHIQTHNIKRNDLLCAFCGNYFEKDSITSHSCLHGIVSTTDEIAAEKCESYSKKQKKKKRRKEREDQSNELGIDVDKEEENELYENKGNCLSFKEDDYHVNTYLTANDRSVIEETVYGAQCTKPSEFEENVLNFNCRKCGLVLHSMALLIQHYQSDHKESYTGRRKRKRKRKNQQTVSIEALQIGFSQGIESVCSEFEDEDSDDDDDLEARPWGKSQTARQVKKRRQQEMVDDKGRRIRKFARFPEHEQLSRNYTCTVCGCVFKSKSDFRQHRKIHIDAGESVN